MSLLKTIETNPSFAPRESSPLPERLISGNPAFKTWAQDVARGEMIQTGVWEDVPRRDALGQGGDLRVLPYSFRSRRTHAGEREAGRLQERRQLRHEAGLRRHLEDNRDGPQDLRDRDVTPRPRDPVASEVAQEHSLYLHAEDGTLSGSRACHHRPRRLRLTI